jgi:peptidoglycan/LPS O-acetylase OafA/YrhL
MIERIKNYIQKDSISVSRIDVIDGIRVLAIGCIAWFHVWQQSWLAPYVRIGSLSIDLMPIPRAGYLWVDMFILLSAFQLFLPHAREMILGERAYGTKEFYIKRLKRILPPYVLSIIVCLYFAVFTSQYQTLGTMLKDLISHLTFTHTFWPDTYLYTKLNVVLWTVAILVQFYIVFPLLARVFKKYSSITFLLMCAVGIVFRVLLVNTSKTPAMFVNQLPAFFDVFAIGMFGAYAFVYMNKKVEYQKMSPLFTIVSIGSLIFIFFAMKDLSRVMGNENLQRWQGINRTWVSLGFLLFVISTGYSMKWYRRIYSNRLAVFLSSISFNFYIWHHYISVKLRDWNFPYSEYADPNVYGDLKWQRLYTLAAFAISIAFAWLVTWLYEGKVMNKLLRAKAEDRSAPGRSGKSAKIPRRR